MRLIDRFYICLVLACNYCACTCQWNERTLVHFTNKILNQQLRNGDETNKREFFARRC